MKLSDLTKGIIKENPTFVLLLGMCPTLATTTSASNGMGMGAATMAVLILSNLMISLIARFIPDKVRIPSYIVVIAALVTMVELLMQVYLPDLHATLGIFIPLIVVNCIVLGRAEAFAAKNSPLASALDGLSIGLGFTLSLTVIGIVRELLGSGSVFGLRLSELAAGTSSKSTFGKLLRLLDGVVPDMNGILIFVLAPGAFLVLGYLMVLFNMLKRKAS